MKKILTSVAMILSFAVGAMRPEALVEAGGVEYRFGMWSDGTEIATVVKFGENHAPFRRYIEYKGERYDVESVTADSNVRLVMLLRSGSPAVTLPASVRTIGGECFFECNDLCGVTFEAGSKLAQVRNVRGDKEALTAELKKDLPEGCRVIFE
jgi:hypothetical protein